LQAEVALNYQYPPCRATIGCGPSPNLELAKVYPSENTGSSRYSESIHRMIRGHELQEYYITKKPDKNQEIQLFLFPTPNMEIE
jgi:hypothetical protein